MQEELSIIIDYSASYICDKAAIVEKIELLLLNNSWFLKGFLGSCKLQSWKVT